MGEVCLLVFCLDVVWNARGPGVSLHDLGAENEGENLRIRPEIFR